MTSMPPSTIGTRSATALVIANMIGTGVFTSLGFQLAEIRSAQAILLLWVVGGIIALAGAFCYAELGAALRRSGGEYHFLSRLYHPLVGYLSGWVSMTVGFSAPVALAAMALAAYLRPWVPLAPSWIATIVLVGVTVIHSVNLHRSSRFQVWTTTLKVILILGFVAAGFLLPAGTPNALDLQTGWTHELFHPAFAVALVYVTYAYSGWNAAAYIIEEIRDPARQLPRALLTGTALVMVMYILLQWVFLRQAGVEDLTGHVEIGQIVADRMLGPVGGKMISLAIAIFLVSSISAMVWVGPRVTHVLAEDHPTWHFLARKNEHGIPVRALWFQSGISLAMIWTGTFEEVLLYCGFILQFFAALAVAGVFRLRILGIERPYRNPTHPWLPLLFLGVSAWILVFLVRERPTESLWGILNLAVGWLIYRIGNRSRI